MLYATLKTIHLLALIVWLGGMFFTLACLRPSLAAIDAPQRPRLMAAVMGRFLDAVGWAAALMLGTGATMMAQMGAGAVPRSVHVMAALGVLMIGVYVFIRLRLYPRLRAAVGGAALDGPAAAAALGTIRMAVLANLAIGTAIVVLTQFAAFV